MNKIYKITIIVFTIIIIGISVFMIIDSSVKSNKKYAGTSTECGWYNNGIDQEGYPDNCATGGFSIHLKSTICSKKYSELEDNVTPDIRDKLMIKYNIPPDIRDGYIIDFIIPRKLGGTSGFNNLWPQDKGEATFKDNVENYLYGRVCGNTMSLRDARNILMTNWTRYREFGG